MNYLSTPLSEDSLYALKAGRMSQVRRVISDSSLRLLRAAAAAGEISNFSDAGVVGVNDAAYLAAACPMGSVGDVFWVKESFMRLSGTGVEHRIDGKLSPVAYRVDSPVGSYGDEARKDYGLKWMPSLSMTEKEARFWMEITNIRIGLARDITERDAIACGTCSDAEYEHPKSQRPIPCPHCHGTREHLISDGKGGKIGKPCTTCATVLQRYLLQWDAKWERQPTFARNPWVWIVDVKLIEQPHVATRHAVACAA